MKNLFRFVGFRHLQHKPLRTALTAVGVALGVALYLAIQIINRSTLHSFRESVDAVAGKTALIVTAGDAGFAESKYEDVRKVAGIRHAVPMIETRAYFAGAKSSETLVVLGVDLLKEQSVRTYKTADEQIIDDPLVFLNQPDSIIITRAFAEKHGFKIDDTFELATPRGRQKFTVRGMLSPDGPARAFGGAIAIMDIDGARMTFGKENKLDRIDLVLKDGEDVSKAAAAVRATLGPGYQVERPSDQSENLEKMVATYQTMTQFFSGLALLVGLFLVSNSITIAVAERKREIGTLRALGATRNGILVLFLSEAVLMGTIGALLGTVLGRGLARALVGMVTQSMSAQFLMKIDVSAMVFGLSDWMNALALGAGASALAAAWPAYRATRIQPLEAMKNREVGEEAARRGFQLYAPLVGFALLGFLVFSSFMGLGKTYPAIETFNQVASMVGCALVAPFMVAYMIRWIRPFTARSKNTISRLAQDNLLRNPRRLGSNIMSLMVGLILVILISAINMSFKTTVYDWMDNAIRADLLISSQGKVISYAIQPIHEDIGKEIAKVPGLRAGKTRTAFGQRFVHVNYEGRRLGMKAFDAPDVELDGYALITPRDRTRDEMGHDLFSTTDPVALVSENFVMHFHKKTGDTMDLETPSGKVTFKIKGIVADFASGEGVLYLNRAVYKKYWNDSTVSAFGVKLAPGVDAQAVRSAIDESLGKEKNLMVISNTELKGDLVKTIDQSFAYTHAIELAALLVGLLGLLNTLLISVMERTRELGMLRAVGMTRGQLRSMILQEALIQGAFGAVIAVMLGTFLAYLWITNSLAHVLGWMIQFHFPVEAIGLTVLAGVTVALLAGYLPARRASRIDIREALEYE